MCSNSSGSTNAVDQTLGHADGPDSSPTETEAKRLNFSKQIVGINYTRLDRLCENTATEGIVYLDDQQSADSNSLRVNIYTDIHNYLSSLYSFVEELHQVINSCVDDSVDRDTFVVGSKREGYSRPPFIRKLVFAWGLRNQFTHGNYRCLRIVKRQDAPRPYMRVRFRKESFDPRGKGDLSEVGNYLWGVEKYERENPMCYFASLNRHFVGFWSDVEEWFSRECDWRQMSRMGR
jgi:hypothetical protein